MTSPTAAVSGFPALPPQNQQTKLIPPYEKFAKIKEQRRLAAASKLAEERYLSVGIYEELKIKTLARIRLYALSQGLSLPHSAFKVHTTPSPALTSPTTTYQFVNYCRDGQGDLCVTYQKNKEVATVTFFKDTVMVIRIDKGGISYTVGSELPGHAKSIWQIVHVYQKEKKNFNYYAYTTDNARILILSTHSPDGLEYLGREFDFDAPLLPRDGVPEGQV